MNTTDLSSDDPAALIAGRLLQVAQRKASLGPYLRRYLAEHVGEVWQWGQLAVAPEVLNRLDPTSVGDELARTAFGRGDIAPVLTVALVAHPDLAAADSAQQPLIRALAAHRLRLPADPLTAAE